MEHGRVVIPDHVPVEWPPPFEPTAVCACAVPIPETRAIWKGAARTHCARCGLPVRLEFGAR
jgi:hypothetical protein